MVLLTAENLNQEQETERNAGEKKYSRLFEDIFYRPPELDLMCSWDIMRNFVKEKKPKSKTQRNTYLKFKPGHPHFYIRPRDAKFDFAEKRRKRLSELKMMAKDKGFDRETTDEQYDPVWENAMQTAVDLDDLDSSALLKNTRATRDANQIIAEAKILDFTL
ncbi:hypothetical protein B0H13DRAFT_1880182 [Mycena leptocephala]|nr:hypothetical protein B0H13DRAFT_1880182 [Mycena leptocephala]